MKLARINPRFIGMTVLVLSLVGCYTQNYRLSDALIAVVFAFIGRLMLRNDIPGFPLVIGLVLGPLFESRMLQSLSLSNGNAMVFLERPISAFLLALAVLSAGVFTYTVLKARKA
jgi:putative tricarboxylic transport membrane protein